MTPALPEHAAMVAAILGAYDRATPTDLAAGRAWYPSARAAADVISAAGRVSTERAALALAALSPRNPWRWNVADAYACAVAVRAGTAAPTCTTFRSNVDRAMVALATGAAPWATVAPKVRAFVAAILGDATAVVVDVWAMRCATSGERDTVRPAEYAAVAAAYRDAAWRTGEDARDLQAITWLVVQREGIGSARRGRHDATIKRGTAPAVAALFV